MDTLQALKTAAIVMRAASFSGAARQLGVSPAAVAKTVAQLETRIGARLFDRTTRHLAVTEEGRDLLAQVEQPLRALDDALGIDRSTGAARGAVKVSVPAAFARMAILPQVAAFQQRYREIQLDLRLENRRIDLVAEGYDCAIGTALAPDSSLIARPLVTLRPVLCASPAYLAAHGVPQSASELAHHRCIGLRSETSGMLRDWEFTVRGRPFKIKPGGALQLNDPESAAAAATAGCGIARVGVHHVSAAILAGQLVRLLVDVQMRPFQIVIYFAKRRLLPPRTRAFVDHILATVPGSKAFEACHQVLGLPSDRRRAR